MEGVTSRRCGWIAIYFFSSRRRHTRLVSDWSSDVCSSDLEAWSRGWDRAIVRVVMGDGSHWIWNNADQHFPGAIQIVDLYHAREHLWGLARKLNPADEAAQKRWLIRKLDWLENGQIEKLATALRKLADAEQNSELAKAISIEAEYFDGNRDRMRYPEFRKKNLFVGSGVIEAGCKTVIGSRLKQSGMFWTV